VVVHLHRCRRASSTFNSFHYSFVGHFLFDSHTSILQKKAHTILVVAISLMTTSSSISLLLMTTTARRRVLVGHMIIVMSENIHYYKVHTNTTKKRTINHCLQPPASRIQPPEFTMHSSRMRIAMIPLGRH
jgi:hypothetical protein